MYFRQKLLENLIEAAETLVEGHLKVTLQH